MKNQLSHIDKKPTYYLLYILHYPLIICLRVLESGMGGHNTHTRARAPGRARARAVGLGPWALVLGTWYLANAVRGRGVGFVDRVILFGQGQFD